MFELGVSMGCFADADYDNLSDQVILSAAKNPCANRKIEQFKLIPSPVSPRGNRKVDFHHLEVGAGGRRARLHRVGGRNARPIGPRKS